MEVSAGALPSENLIARSDLNAVVATAPERLGGRTWKGIHLVAPHPMQDGNLQHLPAPF